MGLTLKVYQKMLGYYGAENTPMIPTYHHFDGAVYFIYRNFITEQMKQHNFYL